jgi:hypothetical protein
MLKKGTHGNAGVQDDVMLTEFNLFGVFMAPIVVYPVCVVVEWPFRLVLAHRTV